MKLIVSGVTANNKVYAGSTTANLNAAGATLVGVITGDAVSLGRVSGALASKHVATNLLITATTIALAGPQADDYTAILDKPLTASITPAPLAVVGIVADKAYDGTTQATLTPGSAALAGVVSGDSVSLAQYSTINIVDADAGASVTFGNSGTIAYATNFNIALSDPAAGTISFSGTSNFGAYNLQASTKRNIVVSNATIEASSGNITLQANQDVMPTNGSFTGISILNATVQSTGSGAITLQGRGGDTGTSYSVYLESFGKVIGGSGVLTFSGTGGATPSGSAYVCFCCSRWHFA